MCGIVGYIGHESALEIIMDGLQRLEYRGYDSAGVAIQYQGRLGLEKRPGKLRTLADVLSEQPIPGTLGIGHTRWATHGPPTQRNAHPHLDSEGKIAVVHNGIIENYRSLRETLESEGVSFRSETDTETLAHLIRRYYSGDLFAAVKRALEDVRGAYAIGVISADEPDVLVAARSGSPLVLGVGDNAYYIASDVPAIMNRTRRVVYLENAQVCAIHRDGYRVEDLEGNPQSLSVETIEWDEAAAEKDGFRHFMLKEIHQQPGVLRNTIGMRVSDHTIHFENQRVEPEKLKALDRIFIVACGTAWHAGLIGKRLIEEFARVPVEVDIASEFRYREPIVDSGTLVIPVSQSGETADTLEAVRIAKSKGARVMSVLNVVGSSIARESDDALYTVAGPEIGVASTKAYTSQIMAFVLFAVQLGKARGTLPEENAARIIEELRGIPEKVQWCLDNQQTIERCAHDPRYRDPLSAFFMGRGYNFPSALEGALKLKEISYIHAEGYAAGEMKHGPIALITDRVPMICIATKSSIYDKVISNIQEIRARKGIILSIATEGDTEVSKHSDEVIYVPDCYEPLSPLVVAAPLQLLAYHIAVNRGCDVDQPRNLAKSVTVE